MRLQYLYRSPGYHPHIGQTIYGREENTCEPVQQGPQLIRLSRRAQHDKGRPQLVPEELPGGKLLADGTPHGTCLFRRNYCNLKAPRRVDAEPCSNIG